MRWPEYIDKSIPVGVRSALFPPRRRREREGNTTDRD
jgi:hypothetical protein